MGYLKEIKLIRRSASDPEVYNNKSSDFMLKIVRCVDNPLGSKRKTMKWQSLETLIKLLNIEVSGKGLFLLNVLKLN